jgi:16S rRNA (cytosine967-C5)-methyltransferase
MTPAARLQASIELWDKITNNKRVPMDGMCGDYFRNRRYIGSKDRNDIVTRVYDMMRAHAKLEWWCDHVGLDKNGRSYALINMIFNEDYKIDDLPNFFNGNKYHPDELSEGEGAALTNIKMDGFLHPDMLEDVINECPSWAYDRLKKLYGDNFAAEMSAMLTPATLDVRVNTIKIDREKAMALLEKDDVPSDPCQYSPVGLRLKSKSYLSRTKVFQKGLIEIQDEGSQLLALICNAKPGMQVLDYCAGGGGKTLALAASMEGKGRIVAMDIESKRLMKSKPRLTKADVHNVELRPLDDDKHKKWLRRQKEKFDVVLVDAPCSSSGTWRRNPDLRWHHYGPTHEAIEQVQGEILDRVWPNVKIGGRLIYATCSLFAEENEHQVQTFLKDHDNFKIIPIEQVWSESEMQNDCPVAGDYMRLTPAQHQTDGFFACIMERVG